MNELFRYYAYGFLVLRFLIDLTVAAFIYRRIESLIVSGGFMSLCGAFYVLLYFGIKNEQFRGRYGKLVILWREPVGYWFCFGFLILLHFVITGGAIAVELTH